MEKNGLKIQREAKEYALERVPEGSKIKEKLERKIKEIKKLQELKNKV